MQPGILVWFLKNESVHCMCVGYVGITRNVRLHFNIESVATIAMVESCSIFVYDFINAERCMTHYKKQQYCEVRLHWKGFLLLEA